MKIHTFLNLILENSASDLHISSGAPAYLRIHGEMQPLEMNALSSEQLQDILFEIMSEKQKRQFIETWELDFAYSYGDTSRFRVNVFMQRKGIGAVLRVIPTKILTVEDLGLPKAVLKLLDNHKGLVCVTGATGSGKSTTLAALIDRLNKSRNNHIITIEDPIEFVHENQLSLINQREVGSHTKSFAAALKAALREDPDIILVGEMRDLETIQLALTAAETGHLVFGTLHTNTAHKTVDRIIDVFPEGKQAQIRTLLAESLLGVVSQNLLRKADGKGRVGAFEILINTKAVGNLIREGKTFQIPSAMQTGRNYGMLTLEACLSDLVNKGTIKQEVMNSLLGKTNESQSAA